MADDTAQRIDDALASLVDAIIPIVADEDEGTADERHDDALELARSILDEYAQTVAQRRLLTNLSDLRPPGVPQENKSDRKYHRDGQPHSRPQSREALFVEFEASRNSGVNPVFSDTFSSAGLQRLPARQDRQVDYPSASGDAKSAQRKEEGSLPGIPIKPVLLAKHDSVTNPPETALLRDLPFTLQGLSSTNLPFALTSSVTLPPTLPIPILSLLHTLAEPSLLYQSLSRFVESSEGGLVGQSLRAAVGEELRSYLGLVASLEGEIRRALSTLGDNEPRGGIGKAGVTLKRCVIWTREATMGLRLMSLMVEESNDKRGGQLISLIHGFSSSHGDPFVGAFAERLLSHVTRPFYDMLRQWIYDGELSDPYLEFLVSEQRSVTNGDQNGDTRKGGATSVWQDKYKLDDDMIPSIMTQEFAKKVFLIGKSLNFIRYECGDSAWVESYSKSASKELRYGDTATLETSIVEAYKTTMARLIHLMADKFKLFEHLKALKKYLLLGQGDFIALLMETLSSHLDRPANTLQRHNLTAQLEHAILGSNAQFETPDVLRRLDARMLELSHGEIGWDVFTLEYKIHAPVDVVITPWGSKQYLKVFNFLWRVKRVEFALGTTWRRCMTGARGVLASVADKVGSDWKVARCCVAEMIHFVCQLQYYILFEVIEASWDTLQEAMTKSECTLDDLIEAHEKYLLAITHKGLLGSVRPSSSGSREDGFLAQLHEILKIMLTYKDAVDGLYSFSVAEFTRRQEMSAKIETRTAQGKWGITEQDDDDLRSPSPASTNRGGRGGSAGTDSPFPTNRMGMGNSEDQMLPSLRQRLQHLSSDFRARVNILLGDLAYQPDVDMRFLGVVMNFNDVYHPVRRKRKEGRNERDRRTTPKVNGAASGSGVSVREAG
ncbi:MAG: Microtubule-nucleating Tub4p (gamma-tubulin) complex component [Pycnora praestabilis]|nr:MAG: Microtubule-nucleating Tub4p (gamma-tubulin) complex component [Pycnora praestabilis]